MSNYPLEVYRSLILSHRIMNASLAQPCRALSASTEELCVRSSGYCDEETQEGSSCGEEGASEDGGEADKNQVVLCVVCCV